MKTIGLVQKAEHNITEPPKNSRLEKNYVPDLNHAKIIYSSRSIEI